MLKAMSMFGWIKKQPSTSSATEDLERHAVSTSSWAFWLERLALSMGSVVVALTVAEMALRWYGHAKNIDFRLYLREITNSERLPPSIWLLEDGLVALKPLSQGLAFSSDFSVHYAINEVGLRDRPLAAHQQKLTLLAIGDSYTFGEGVESGATFVDRLESKLGVNLLNLGVPGYGLGFAFAHLKLTLPFLGPVDGLFIFFNWDLYNRRHPHFDNPNLPLLAEDGVWPPYLAHTDPLLDQSYTKLKYSYVLSYLMFLVKVRNLQNKFKEFDQGEWKEITESSIAKWDQQRAVIKDPTHDAATQTLFEEFLNLAKTQNLPG